MSSSPDFYRASPHVDARVSNDGRSLVTTDCPSEDRCQVVHASTNGHHIHTLDMPATEHYVRPIVEAETGQYIVGIARRGKNIRSTIARLNHLGDVEQLTEETVDWLFVPEQISPDRQHLLYRRQQMRPEEKVGFATKQLCVLDFVTLDAWCDPDGEFTYMETTSYISDDQILVSGRQKSDRGLHNAYILTIGASGFSDVEKMPDIMGPAIARGKDRTIYVRQDINSRDGYPADIFRHDLFQLHNNFLRRATSLSAFIYDFSIAVDVPIALTAIWSFERNRQELGIINLDDGSYKTIALRPGRVWEFVGE